MNQILHDETFFGALRITAMTVLTIEAVILCLQRVRIPIAAALIFSQHWGLWYAFWYACLLAGIILFPLRFHYKWKGTGLMYNQEKNKP